MNMKNNNILICFYVLLLLGCGAKGSLYIPEERYPQSKFDKNKNKIFINQTKIA